ncbi:hypothetical protein M407DRAFT_244832 [Tulasnella calospora MUT 4182]|uniref:Uncharacterized protein n=1 Tax=Tulasnella calospora MUT 4182 TaxID=1051891 RepID=A0A0C3Q3K5_9AGAM|nr:hypothetical protein M407DRAFT_244832 [Tulasnella calospora MUT 4182]
MEIKSLFKKNTGNCGETIPFVHMMDRIESETLTNLRSLAIHLPLLKKYLRENPNAEVITTATIHECFIAACGSCKAISDEANFAAEEYRLRIPTSRHGYGGYFSSYGSMKYDREVI